MTNTAEISSWVKQARDRFRSRKFGDNRAYANRFMLYARYLKATGLNVVYDRAFRAWYRVQK